MKTKGMNLKTALIWLIVPTVLVAAYFGYKYFKKPKNGDNTEGVKNVIKPLPPIVSQTGVILGGESYYWEGKNGEKSKPTKPTDPNNR